MYSQVLPDIKPTFRTFLREHVWSHGFGQKCQNDVIVDQNFVECWMHKHIRIVPSIQSQALSCSLLEFDRVQMFATPNSCSDPNKFLEQTSWNPCGPAEKERVPVYFSEGVS